MNSSLWLLLRTLERNGPSAELDMEIARAHMPLPAIEWHIKEKS